MTDLILRGGRVIDPARGFDGVTDVFVTDGVLEAEGVESPATRVLDCRGLYVVPGLIDLHTHVFTAGMEGAIGADVAGVTAGVTTVVDAGSSGLDTFETFRAGEHAAAVSRVIVFLNLGRSGLAQPPEIRSPADLDLNATIDLIGRHADVIKGVKVRVVAAGVAALGLDLVRHAKTVASAHGLPVMVHVGDPDDDPRCAAIAADVVNLLEPGDILTHAFSDRAGALLSQPELISRARQAQDQGVFLDVGHGVRNFAFDSARRLIDAGVLPNAISTDMGKRPRRGPAYSMTETMSKLLHLGIPLPAVVAMATAGPAAALGRDDLGRLEPGRVADVTLLRERVGCFRFRDSRGNEEIAERGLEPVAVVRAGRLISADWGPHPEGWLRPV